MINEALEDLGTDIQIDDERVQYHFKSFGSNKHQGKYLSDLENTH